MTTTEQTVENQQRELETVAERHGWDVVAVFTDAGISGTKGRDKRPGYDRLCRGIARRESIRWRLGLLTGSVAHYRNWSRSSANCTPKGVDLCLNQQGLDTGTPAGKAMFQMMGVFAKFERAMIVERVKGRRPVSRDVVERIRAQLATGSGILKTAKALSVGTGTVHRVKREMAAVAA